MKRMLLPILKKYWKPLLATMLISSIGCSYMIGIFGGYLSLKDSLYEYVEDYGYPDAFITTAMTDRSKVAALQAVPGVETVNARAVADTVLRSDEGRMLSVRCFSFNEGDRGRMYAWSSADSAGADEVFLEYNFAVANNIKAGDTVQIKLADEWRDIFVGAIVSAPETMTVQPTDTGWTLKGDFGYVYVSVDLLEKEYDRRYGEARSELDEKGGELADARREADEALAQVRAPLDAAAALLAEKDALLADSRLEAAETRAELLEKRLEMARQQERLRKQLEDLQGTRDKAAQALEALRQAVEALDEMDSAQSELTAKEEEVRSQRDALAEAVDALTMIEEKLTELDAQEAELKTQRARLDEALDGLDQIDSATATLGEAGAEAATLRSEFEAAMQTLDMVNTKLAEVEAQEQQLTQPVAALGVRLLRLLPEKTPLESVTFALNGLKQAVTSPTAQRFYPVADAVVENTADYLVGFASQAQADAPYLVSDDTRAMLSRLEMGAKGVEESDAYQTVADIISRYGYTVTPGTLPGLVRSVRDVLEAYLEWMEQLDLDALRAELDSFDASVKATSLADGIDAFAAMLASFNSAAETELTTTGEVVTFYDDALFALADGKAQLESARTQLLDARAAAYAQAQARLGVPVTSDEELYAAFDDAITALNAAGEELVNTRNQITDALDGAVREMTERTGTPIGSYDELLPTIDSAMTALTDGRTQLLDARAQVEDALREQGISESELPDLLAAADEGLAAIADGWGQLEAARTELRARLEAEGVSLGAYPTERDAIAAAITGLEDSLTQLDDSFPLMDSAISLLGEGVRQIGVGLGDLETELDDADRQLADARAELEENERSYQKSLADTLFEFASLEDELREAYAALEDGQGFEELCNQFLLWFDDGADPEATLAAAKAALGDVEIKSAYDFADSPVKLRIDENLHPVYTMSNFIPTVFFAVVMVITFLFMSLIVRQSRREIGILRAVGHSVASIRGLFCGVSLVVSLAAIVVGFIVSVAFTWFVGKQNTSFFTLPIYRLRIAWFRILLCFFLNLAVGQFSTLISTGLIARISPTEAMSRPAPSTVRIPGFLGRLAHRARPMAAFSITTLFRNPLRFFVSTVCVAASIMMIFSSLSVITSNNYQLVDLYERRIHYDCQIFYHGEVGDETMDQLRELGILEDVQRSPIYIMDISFGEQTVSSTVITALEPDTELLSVYDVAGNRLTPVQSENGIILEHRVAEQLGVKTGDAVLVDGRHSMVVEGISFQSSSQSHYISLEGAKTLGSDCIDSVICRIAPEDEQQLLEAVVAQEDYLYTVFSRLAYESFNEQLQTYHFLGWVSVAFAAIMGFLIVFNIARTNLLEKKRELCILRTMGFQRWEISKSWSLQSFVQFLCACAIGLPLGRFVAATMMQLMSTKNTELIYVSTLRELLITLAVVVFYMTFSHFAAMRDLKNWNIVESVQDKE